MIIVLDACRYDRFEPIFNKYFKGDLNKISSEGRNTFEYVRRCWPEKHNLAYISAAPPINNERFDFEGDTDLQGIAASNQLLKKRYKGYRPVDHIDDIIEVWRSDWDPILGVCPPEPVTDIAKEYAKKESKLVVHYFQPHAPYIGKKRKTSQINDVGRQLEGGAIDFGIWDEIRQGRISNDELIELYDSNIERVMNSIADLIENTDYSKVIIMGDHGEALGELGIYAHPSLPHPYTRVIPWAEITDVKDFESNNYRQESESIESHDKTAEDRLKELGYL